jgi:LysR family pca operon transcriptional activator
MPYHGTIIRQEIERFLLAQGVHQPTDLVETTSVDFAHAYVQQSDAIWFVPRGYMASAVAQKFLSELPLDTRALEGPVGITIRADTKRTPAAQQMIDVLRVTAESRTTHS